MLIKEFLENVCKQIKYKPAKNVISQELEEHIEEIKEDYIKSGINEKEAEEKAVKQMGEAEKIGKELNKVHKPKLDWKLILLILILIGVGIFINMLKQNDINRPYLANSISFTIIGSIIGISIYFFDYRKIKKYSNIIYIVATLIVLISLLGLGININGVKFIWILHVKVMPSMIVVPLYIIAFVGFIINYNKENKIEIKNIVKDDTIIIQKDLIKIIGLSIISLILISLIPSVINAIILGTIYIIITSIKLSKLKENRKKYLNYLGTTIICIAIISTIILVINTNVLGAGRFRIERIISSFKPEIDPNGSGYIGMLQKEILDNAKFIGESDTNIIYEEESIIKGKSNYTYIYIIGKCGILVAGLILLTIILVSIKIILNAKKIKDEYGKLLIIGLGMLYIIQSILNVLMNVNLGIQSDINLPFISYGGMYLIINIINIALILSIYRRKDINFTEEKRCIEIKYQ